MKRIAEGILTNVQKWADEVLEAVEMLPIGHPARQKLMHLALNLQQAKVTLERLLLSETKN
jgi:hypothetical protein